MKKILDQQAVTHSAAGEFLHLMKALMAKLKVNSPIDFLAEFLLTEAQANDWGALSRKFCLSNTP